MPTDPQFWSEVFLQTLTLFVLIVGLLGLIVPVFPGLIIMWLAALFYALIENSLGRMAWIDWTLFALITLLMLGGSVIDNIIIANKMRGHSIPWSSIGLSYLAGILASLFLTPVVGIFASPLALFGAEYLRLRNRKQAFDSARTYMIAWGWSFLTVFGVGVLMIIFWLFWAWM
ncbi:MAG: DUF456 domain-containing protein [Chloroflexi bacterium]|nr:DUF456 domain-containing protein [Chloroflexota bacterium]MBI3341454.1 DUF456 domain-containing protein [Chloroflexota bacterium]